MLLQAAWGTVRPKYTSLKSLAVALFSSIASFCTVGAPVRSIMDLNVARESVL